MITSSIDPCSQCKEKANVAYQRELEKLKA